MNNLTLTEKLNYMDSIFEYNIVQIMEENDITYINKILNESLISDSIDKVKNAYYKNINLAKKFLIDKKVDVKHIEKEASSISKEIKSDIKNRKNPKIIQDKAVRSLYKIIDEEKEKFVEYSFHEKVLYSIIVFIIVVFLNSLFLIPATLLFGPQIGFIILATTIGPVIEETAKKFAIEQGYPWVYVTIFGGLELLQYVMGVVASGGLLGPMLIVRLVSLMMHFSTTYIQKYYFDKDKNKSEDDNENYTEFGYFMAVMTHICFNIFGVIINNKVNTFVGL